MVLGGLVKHSAFKFKFKLLISLFLHLHFYLLVLLLYILLINILILDKAGEQCLFSIGFRQTSLFQPDAILQKMTHLFRPDTCLLSNSFMFMQALIFRLPLFLPSICSSAFHNPPFLLRYQSTHQRIPSLCLRTYTQQLPPSFASKC